MEAGALNCPECGAAVTRDMPQCPYCRALLQTVACTRCHGMMFLGTKFCPHCGAAAKPVAVGGETATACPRCHVPMVEVKLASTEVEECPRCGGLWMSIADFDRICSDAEAQTAASALALPPPAEMDLDVKYLRCPECAQPMGRVNYAHRSGIITNVCRSHGVWLDRDQLRQIVEFIRSGGLDRARWIEKEQLESERRKLETERRVRDSNAGTAPSDENFPW